MAEIDGAAIITIWCARQRKIFVARDRSGIVPGFYTLHDDVFMWGSEMSSLLAVGVPSEVHLPALDYLLGAHYVPSPWSFIKNIGKIPPAHTINWAGQRDPKLERYWHPSWHPKFEGTLNEQVDGLQSRIENAIRKRSTPSDRTGILLSGGVDSMLIAGLTARAGLKPTTFTFRYMDYEGELNEVKSARALADHFGLPHHVIPFCPRDFADNIDDMVRNFGEPFDYGVHTYVVNKVAAAGMDAVLTGVGPDGWYLSPTSRLALKAARIPSSIRRAGETLVPLVRLLSDGIVNKIAGVLQEARVGMPIIAYPRESNSAFRASLFQEEIYEHAGQCLRPDQMALDFETLKDQSRHDRLTFAGANYYSADTILYWNTAWSRDSDLPIRHPFFDNEVYDFLMRLPRRETNKYHFREMAARIMPHEMAFAPKVYQAAPLSHWFRGPLRELLHDRLSPDRIKANGLFNPTTVASILSRHMAGDENHEWTLMLLLTTTAWQELTP